MMNFDAFCRDYIPRCEGMTVSLDPDDAGNWYDAATGRCARGVGALIGSRMGVTGAALAIERGTRAVTKADMAALTLDEAIEVARNQFLIAPGLDRLLWDPVVASAFDFGWGTGPIHGPKVIQQLARVDQDGVIGPVTIAAYNAYIARIGYPTAALALEKARDEYYDLVIAANPIDEKYRQGWYNRSHFYAPDQPWWTRFMA